MALWSFHPFFEGGGMARGEYPTTRHMPNNTNVHDCIVTL